METENIMKEDKVTRDDLAWKTVKLDLTEDACIWLAENGWRERRPHFDWSRYDSGKHLHDGIGCLDKWVFPISGIGEKENDPLVLACREALGSGHIAYVDISTQLHRMGDRFGERRLVGSEFKIKKWCKWVGDNAPAIASAFSTTLHLELKEIKDKSGKEVK